LRKEPQRNETDDKIRLAEKSETIGVIHIAPKSRFKRIEAIKNDTLNQTKLLKKSRFIDPNQKKIPLI